MLEEKIHELRPSVEETDALLLGNKQSNKNLHTGTPGDRSCCRLATHGRTALMQSLSLHGDVAATARGQRLKRCH
jgi:hypothetical protein